MPIDLKDLDKVMRLCRKHGVKNIKIGDIEFTLDDTVLPSPKAYRASAEIPDIPGSELQHAQIKTDLPSPEDLLFWSASGQMEAYKEANGGAQ